MTDDATPSGHRYGGAYWGRILIVNALGGLAAFGLLGGFVGGRPWSARWWGLVVSLLYAKSVGGLAAVAMPWVVRRVAGLGPVRRWLARLLSISTLIALGCAIGTAGLIALGLIRWSEGRTYCWMSLRIILHRGNRAEGR